MDLSRFDNRPFRPRDFQFSLARMLVAMTVFAVLLSFRLPLSLEVIRCVFLGVVVFLILFFDWSVWHVENGDTALRVGDHAGAIRAFTRAIEADPEDPGRYYRRAVAYARSRDVDAAIRDYTKAIGLNVRYAPAWIGRADAKRQRGELQAAIDDVTIGLCVLPADPEMWIARVLGLAVRGACYLALGRTEEASEEFDEAIRWAPNKEIPYVMRGLVYLETKDYDQALRDFDHGIRQDKVGYDTLVSWAVALFKLGHYETAFDHIRTCRRRYPMAIDALCAHAWFLATCPEKPFRDGRSALALARIAHRLATDDDWACQASLAAAFAELGLFDEAVRCAERALELAPAISRRDLQDPLSSYKAGQPYRDRGSGGLS